MAKRCVVSRKPAADVLERPARVRELAGERFNSTPQQLSGAHKSIKAIMEGNVISKRSKTTLSGRALIYVAPFNSGASLCIGKKGNRASIAICKPKVRGAAQPGDVILAIPPSLTATRSTLIFLVINMLEAGPRMRGPVEQKHKC